MPVRVGQSYLGVIIYGIVMYVLLIALSYLLGYVYNTYFGFNGGIEGSMDSLLVRAKVLPSTLLSHIYVKLWLVLIVSTVLCVLEYKYALPRDILSKFTRNFKAILVLSFGFILLAEFVLTFVYLLDEEWSSALFVYVLRPLIDLFFIFLLVKTMGEERTIKQAIIEIIDTLRKWDGVAGLIIAYALYLFCYNVPRKVIRIAMDTFYQGYVWSTNDEIDWSFQALLHADRAVNGIVVVFFLTVIIGVTIFTLRADPKSGQAKVVKNINE